MSTELLRDELAKIYRQLNPSQIYLGDPPERWSRAVLLCQIRRLLLDAEVQVF